MGDGMASVGGISCTFVKGEIAGQSLDTTVWRVPGINGYGAQTLGLGAGPFAVRAVVFGSESAVSAWMLAIESLRGTAVTIVDDWGRSHGGCLIVQPPQRMPRRFRTNHDGLGECRGEMLIEGVRA